MQIISRDANKLYVLHLLTSLKILNESKVGNSNVRKQVLMDISGEFFQKTAFDPIITLECLTLMKS